MDPTMTRNQVTDAATAANPAPPAGVTADGPGGGRSNDPPEEQQEEQERGQAEQQERGQELSPEELLASTLRMVEICYSYLSRGKRHWHDIVSLLENLFKIIKAPPNFFATTTVTTSTNTATASSTSTISSSSELQTALTRWKDMERDVEALRLRDECKDLVTAVQSFHNNNNNNNNSNNSSNSDTTGNNDGHEEEDDDEVVGHKLRKASVHMYIAFCNVAGIGVDLERTLDENQSTEDDIEPFHKALLSKIQALPSWLFHDDDADDDDDDTAEGALAKYEKTALDCLLLLAETDLILTRDEKDKREFQDLLMEEEDEEDEYKTKLNKYKVDCIPGLSDDPVEETTLVGWPTVRTGLVLAATHGWKSMQVDFTLAFCQSPQPEDQPLHMELPQCYWPQGMEDRDVVLKMNKSICGQNSAPVLFWRFLSKGMDQLGFDSCESYPCCFVHRELPIMVLNYCDDQIWLSPRQWIDRGVMR